MAAVRFLPRRLQTAFDKVAMEEHVKNLLLLSSPTHITFFDDFVGSPTGTWPANANWMYPATVGTGTEVIGITAAVGGTLTCTTGNTSGNGAYQYLGLNWKASQGIYALWRAKMNQTATSKFEIGLTDSITNEGIVNAKATPTWTATDAACFCYDTSHNSSIAFMTVANGTTGANASWSGTADTNYHWFEIVVQGGFASGYIDGQFVGGGAITSTATLGPQVGGSTTRAASTATTTTDLCFVAGPRFSI